MFKAVTIKNGAQQAALNIAGVHQPVRNWEGQVHVVAHHDAEVVMGGMVTPNCVYEGHIANEPVLMGVAAIVKRLINQVLSNHRDDKNEPKVRVVEPAGPAK